MGKKRSSSKKESKEKGKNNASIEKFLGKKKEEKKNEENQIEEKKKEENLNEVKNKLKQLKRKNEEQIEENTRKGKKRNLNIKKENKDEMNNNTKNIESKYKDTKQMDLEEDEHEIEIMKPKIENEINIEKEDKEDLVEEENEYAEEDEEEEDDEDIKDDLDDIKTDEKNDSKNMKLEALNIFKRIMTEYGPNNSNNNNKINNKNNNNANNNIQSKEKIYEYNYKIEFKELRFPKKTLFERMKEKSKNITFRFIGLADINNKIIGYIKLTYSSLKDNFDPKSLFTFQIDKNLFFNPYYEETEFDKEKILEILKEDEEYFIYDNLPKKPEKKKIKKFRQIKKCKNNINNLGKSNHQSEFTIINKKAIWVIEDKDRNAITALNKYSNRTHFLKSLDENWNGYKNQKIIFMRFFNITNLDSATMILNWLRNGKIKETVDGETKDIIFETLVILSTNSIETVFKNNEQFKKCFNEYFKTIVYDEQLMDQVVEYLRNPDIIPSVAEQYSRIREMNEKYN